MLTTSIRDNLNKIVVLNPKGGCGKSTLVTNLAARYAQQGPTPVVMDFDPQGSSMAWLDRRSPDLPEIHGIAAFKKSMHATRSWQLRIPGNASNVLVDSPASVNHDNLRELTRDATSILVPVLPSSMDIHAASRCIADLLLVAKIDRRDRKLAYTTVLTFLTRLEQKGFVTSDKSGLAYVYRPEVSRERVSRSRLRSLLEDLYDGAAAPLVLQLVRDEGLTRDDIQELQELIDTLDDEPRRSRSRRPDGGRDRKRGRG